MYLTKSKTPLIALFFCLITVFLTTLPLFSGSGGTPKQPTQAPQAEAEIRAILEKWRDKIKPTLDQKWVAEIEKQTMALSADAPDGVFPISYEDSESKHNINVTPKANRRDWSFALDGFMFTFLGGNYANQEHKLDIGFWCFLEASLIHMLPDHLASVAFHLNERGEYDDAISILIYAKSLNPYHHTTRNDLAHSLSCKGSHKAAYDEMSQAASLKPSSERYQEEGEKELMPLLQCCDCDSCDG